jgi:DNA-binding beta-propeller fold protein YncE
VFLLAAAPALCANVARQEPRVRAVLCLSTLAVGVAAAALRSPAFGLFAALAVLGAAVWATERRDEVRAGALLVAASGALGAVTELVFVWDRMNTVFKYYLEMWLMLGSGAAVLAWAFARSARPRARRAFGAGLAVATAGGLFTSVTGAAGFLAHPFAASDVPTLDGMAYLERTGRGAELAAFRWLNREMPGIPVIVEAQGPPYQAFSRVSMNTGLPTLVGWEYHLFQQGRSRQELAARAGNVREIYESADLARAEELLRGYRVDLLFVGPLERDTYGAAGAAKFAASSMVQPVFRHGEVTIYATPGRARGAKTWIDPVPVESIALPVRAPLREPRDIALAPDGTLVVADFGNRRVQRLGRDLQPVGAFGRQGGEGGAFRDPCGIAVDDEGNVIVADTWNHRIQTLGADGRALAAWGGGLYGPRGVAVAPDGGVYVTDTGNHRVLRFSPDGTPHVIVQGVLDNPVGIAVAPGGEIYVADTGHRRVAVFSPDGAPLRAWKVPGWVPAPRMEPYLAVGPDGIVWVTEPTSRQVLLFAPDGTPVGTASGDRPLELPLGIAVIDTDTAAVTDAATGRVVEVRRGGRPRHGN